MRELSGNDQRHPGNMEKHRHPSWRDGPSTPESLLTLMFGDSLSKEVPLTPEWAQGTIITENVVVEHCGHHHASSQVQSQQTTPHKMVMAKNVTTH